MAKHYKIAITGQMRAGKDTLYHLIVEHLERVYRGEGKTFSIQQHTFGGQLKHYAQELFPERFEEGKKPRKLFQDFGQLMRQINENVWVNKVQESIEKQVRNASHCDVIVSIVTDLRQPNEYQYCKDKDFFIIRVTADDRVRMQRAMDAGDTFAEADLQHETEKFIYTYDVDFEVKNNLNNSKSKNRLKLKVKQTIDKLTKKKGE